MASRKRSLSNDADMRPLYKEWDEVSCPICMDHPHNAVLLLCSSHDKGCRSYICDTSYRHSNCLDRFKKLKASSSSNLTHGNQDVAVETSDENMELRNSNDPSIVHGNPDAPGSEAAFPGISEERGSSNADHPSGSKLKLKCPMCRGDILGWKVVEEARTYLNLKPRGCSGESCSFIGNYRDLRSHARRVHPRSRPADVDPSRQRAWRRLENQREYDDIVSAIRSAMPGAVVLGDYVIENGNRLSGERERNLGESGRWLSTFFLFQMIGSMDPISEQRARRSRVLSRHQRRSNGPFTRRRYPWGENLLGLQEDEDEEEVEEEDEADVNIASDTSGDISSNPRRRRRLRRSRSDDDQH